MHQKIENNISVIYQIVKNEPTPEVGNIIQSIYDYVQNNPIYFGCEPRVVNGTFIIGIVGCKADQDLFFEKMKSKVDKLGGKLLVLK